MSGVLGSGQALTGGQNERLQRRGASHWETMMEIKGVQFLSDQKGQKTGVLIDLKRHRRIWEDLYDAMLAESRRGEPRVAWEAVKKRLKRAPASRG